MKNEVLAFFRYQTRSLVVPTRRSEIRFKWAFEVKENPYGAIQKYKARFLAKGSSKMAGFDFNETSSPVTKSTIIYKNCSDHCCRKRVVH